MIERIDFDSGTDAEQALKQAGFSVGTTQRDEPRGILLGEYTIMKWRNLSGDDRSKLHATLERVFRGPDSPVFIRINPKAPLAVKNRLLSLKDGDQS